MLKEIYEQPESIGRATGGRLLVDEGTCKLGGINLSVRDMLDVNHVCFVGCGTSYHAGLLGVYLIEKLARIPATAEIAPELKYRNPIVRKKTLYVGISQSGETVDTNSTLQEVLNKGGHAIGICNVVGSSMARLLGAGIYVHAGLEVSVCSTKAFTSQIAAIYQLAILIARSRDLSANDGERLVRGLQELPGKVSEVLARAEEARAVAKRYSHLHNFLFMGRGMNYAVALEGALKLKEVAYVFAQGYSSSEMKHGAIALIDPECASIFIVPDDEMKTKNLSNIEEVRARHGRVLAIATDGDTEAEKVADDVLYIPKTEPELTPFLSVIYLQFFSYYVALELGRDIDQPRNLAKSVTVE
jgi:glucosamine--fructose-6-phosphate aminotransferase (isomerizing)